MWVVSQHHLAQGVVPKAEGEWAELVHKACRATQQQQTRACARARQFCHQYEDIFEALRESQSVQSAITATRSQCRGIRNIDSMLPVRAAMAVTDASVHAAHSHTPSKLLQPGPPLSHSTTGSRAGSPSLSTK